MVGKTIIYVQMCELENLNQEDINLLENEINGNNEIYFPEELHNISQLPILSIDEIVDFSKVEIIKTEKPKYKDASQFNDKYLYELYVEIYEKKYVERAHKRLTDQSTNKVKNCSK